MPRSPNPVATLPCQSGNRATADIASCSRTLQLYHAKAETRMPRALPFIMRMRCNFTMPKRKHFGSEYQTIRVCVATLPCQSGNFLSSRQRMLLAVQVATLPCQSGNCEAAQGWVGAAGQVATLPCQSGNAFSKARLRTRAAWLQLYHAKAETWGQGILVGHLVIRLQLYHAKAETSSQ